LIQQKDDENTPGDLSRMTPRRKLSTMNAKKNAAIKQPKPTAY